jgi:hypothetical protein
MLINDLFNNKKTAIAEAREIYNKKGRLQGTWDGYTFTMDPEAQARANEELGPEWVEGFMAMKTEQLRDEQQSVAMQLQNSDVMARRPVQPKREYYELAFRMLADQQDVAEGRFQDEYPEYGGKDKNKAMTYDRNVGMGYEGEPWSDSNSNWSGDNPIYADSTYEPDTVTLRGSDGKEKEYSPDSPEYQGVLDREYGIQNKLGQITKAFQKGIDFNANRPRPYTNLATSDSTNDFTDPIKLGQYDVDFPEQTVDKFDAQSGQFTQQIIPSPNDPDAPFQKPVEPVKAKVPAADGSSNSATRSLNAKPDSNSKFVLYDPIKQRPVTQANQTSAKAGTSKAASIPAKPRPGSWQELAKLNNITDPTKLRANTFIKTPDGEEVYVNKGDTLSGLAQRMRNAGTGNRRIKEGNPVPGQNFTTSQGMAEEEGDGFDDITTFSDMRTTDQGGKTNQTYTSGTIAKNPATGQQQSLGRWDHTDPKTGKNYSGTNYIDAQGNADVQKNYKESQDQLDELDKKTVASWVRQQPERIKGDTGLSRTNFKKAKRLVDKSIPSAIAKYKDPSYGKQEKRMDEVSLRKYREKAPLSRAMAQADKFFGRDDPAAVAAADRTIANREKGMARADARRKPYTAPPVDQDKQRRDLADKYPNIDELVRRAELRRDPQYDRADGQAYYDGRDAEQNYHRLKQIQRMIRGAELDEMDFGGVGQVTDSDTGDVTTNFNQGPLSVSQTKTPGGYTKQTDQQVNLGTATLGAKTVGPNIGSGQLAGTTTKTATNNMTGQAKQQVKGVGFGGASGTTVGKNYVGSSDDELAKLAADSATGINEEPNQATLNVPGASFTANKSTNTVSGTTNVHGVDLTATRNLTPGGARTFSASTNVAPNLNMTATQKSADYSKGQLAGTKAVSAKYTDTTGALGKPGQQHTATRTAGVGFGGATGANVGKNYVDQYSVNESVDRLKHLAGIKPAR